MSDKNIKKDEAQKLSLDELLTFTFVEADDFYQQAKDFISKDYIDPRIQVDVDSPLIRPEIVVIIKDDDPIYEDAKSHFKDVQKKPCKNQCILDLYDVTEIFAESSKIFKDICSAQHLLNIWAERLILEYIKSIIVDDSEKDLRNLN